jgi:hypothetical protein
MLITEAWVAQSVQCLTTDGTTGQSSFDPRQRQKVFSSSICVQTGYRAHLASCPVGIGGPFHRAKAQPGRDADHSSPSHAKVNNE